MFVGQHTTWGCGPHLANGCKTKTAIYIYIEYPRLYMGDTAYIWIINHLLSGMYIQVF